MSFMIFYNETTPFYAMKTKSFKNRKIDIFPKGFPWFWSKNGHFSNFFFLGNIVLENVYYDILERKNVFIGYKNKNIKILKKCHLSKVVNPRFWFKNGRFFQFLFFRQYRPGQSLLRYSRTKNAFLGYKTTKMFKKWKN